MYLNILCLVIFDVIGTPTAVEIDALTDEKARKYLSSLPKKNPINIKTIFPAASNSCMLFFCLMTFVFF